LLELLGSELKFSEWRKPQRGEDLKEVGNNMDWRALMYLGELEGKEHMSSS